MIQNKVIPQFHSKSNSSFYEQFYRGGLGDSSCLFLRGLGETALEKIIVGIFHAAYDNFRTKIKF